MEDSGHLHPQGNCLWYSLDRKVCRTQNWYGHYVAKNLVLPRIWNQAIHPVACSLLINWRSNPNSHWTCHRLINSTVLLFTFMIPLRTLLVAWTIQHWMARWSVSNESEKSWRKAGERYNFIYYSIICLQWNGKELEETEERYNFIYYSIICLQWDVIWLGYVRFG
jgi:hypothetical protein